MLIILAFIALLVLPVLAVVLFNKYYSASSVSTTETASMDAVDLKMLKRYTDADIYRNRPYALVAGLFITMTFTYLALEYKAYDKVVIEKKADVSIVEDEIEDIQITNIEPPPPPPAKKSIVLEVVEDDELIEEVDEPEEEEDLDDDFYDPDMEVEIPKEEVVKAPTVFQSTEIRAEPKEGMMVFNNKLMGAVFPKLQALGSYLDDVNPGVVMLKFIVLENGQLANVEVMQGIDPKVDQIVKAEFTKVADYNPGKNQGQAVRSHMQYPVIIMFE